MQRNKTLKSDTTFCPAKPASSQTQEQSRFTYLNIWKIMRKPHPTSLHIGQIDKPIILHGVRENPLKTVRKVPIHPRNISIIRRMHLDVEVDPVIRVIYQEGWDTTARGFGEKSHLCAEDRGVFVLEWPVVGDVDFDVEDYAVFVVVSHFA